MRPHDLAKLADVRALCRSGAARQIRQRNDLSLGECAASVGVARSTIQRWEQGERRPCGERGLKYAALLDSLLQPVGRRR